MGSPRSSRNMVKFLKDGKIVVCLQGRYAGKKAVILKTDDEGTKDRPYGHCVVAGVGKAPLPITKAMCKPTEKMKKLVQRRSRIKTMVKTLKTHLAPDTFTDPHAKTKFLKASRQVFEAKYKEREGQRWLFEKLRF